MTLVVIMQSVAPFSSSKKLGGSIDIEFLNLVLHIVGIPLVV